MHSGRRCTLGLIAHDRAATDLWPIVVNHEAIFESKNKLQTGMIEPILAVLMDLKEARVKVARIFVHNSTLGHEAHA